MLALSGTADQEDFRFLELERQDLWPSVNGQLGPLSGLRAAGGILVLTEGGELQAYGNSSLRTLACTSTTTRHLSEWSKRITPRFHNRWLVILKTVVNQH